MTSIIVTAYIERLQIQLEQADGSNWAALMASIVTATGRIAGPCCKKETPPVA